jgi:hypothetical protein
MAELESIPLTKQQKRLQHLHEFEVAHQKRKINRMKRMAEEWIMMCESSENLFRATLKEMGVDPKIWEKLGLRIGIDYSDVAEYKKLYLESLPSFQEWMIERIDGLHDEKVREDDAQFIEWMERCRNDSAMQEFQQFYSDPTPSIEYSLEKVDESNKRMDVCLEWLGESAFVDTKFQKKYRKMNKSLNLEEQLRGHYRIEMERCARSMKDFEREDFALMRLQYQREAGLAASSSPDGTSSKGNIANDKLHQWVIKNSTKLIEKQQKKTGYYKERADDAMKRVNQVRQKLKDATVKKERPLKLGEYDEATKSLMSLSSGIISSLAIHIASRHEEDLRVLMNNTKGSSLGKTSSTHRLLAARSSPLASSNTANTIDQTIPTQEPQSLLTPPPLNAITTPKVWQKAVTQFSDKELLPPNLGGMPENIHLSWYGDKILSVHVAESLFNLFDATLHRSVASTISHTALSNDFMNHHIATLLPQFSESQELLSKLTRKNVGTIIETAVARCRLQKKEVEIDDLAQWLKTHAIYAEMMEEQKQGETL